MRRLVLLLVLVLPLTRPAVAFEYEGPIPGTFTARILITNTNGLPDIQLQDTFNSPFFNGDVLISGGSESVGIQYYSSFVSMLGEDLALTYPAGENSTQPWEVRFDWVRGLVVASSGVRVRTDGQPMEYEPYEEYFHIRFVGTASLGSQSVDFGVSSEDEGLIRTRLDSMGQPQISWTFEGENDLFSIRRLGRTYSGRLFWTAQVYIPEPSTALLAGLGLGILGAGRRAG